MLILSCIDGPSGNIYEHWGVAQVQHSEDTAAFLTAAEPTVVNVYTKTCFLLDRASCIKRRKQLNTFRSDEIETAELLE